MTSENSPPSDCGQMTLFPMSSAAGSRARTSATLVKVPELTASAPAFGRNIAVSLAKYDPDMSSWRTCRPFLIEGLDGFSETWPRSGLMRSGTAYQLPPLARRTDAIASGLWPTPGAAMSDPAPDVWLASQERHRLRGENKQMDLTTAVRLWPTPTAEDGESKGMSRKRLMTRKPDNLATAVRFPTPAARDYRHPNAKPYSARGGGTKGEQLPNAIGGALNPTWVEWLMGLPLRWTVVSD